MKAEDFNKVVEKRITDLHETLSIKGNEYAKSAERLRNFKAAARDLSIPPELVCFTWVSKHWDALREFVKQVEDNQVVRSQWEEKIGDIIAYMVLLDGLIQDRGIKKEVIND